MHQFSTSSVNAVLKIIADFRRMTGEKMSKEIWRLGDFDFNLVEKSTRNPNKEFNSIIMSLVSTIVTEGCYPSDRDLQEFAKYSVMGWSIILNMRDQWEQYGLSIDEIPSLSHMNKMAEESKPFLENYSILQQIYLLQKLASSDMTVAEFFASPPEVPQLTIKHINLHVGAGGYLWLAEKNK